MISTRGRYAIRVLLDIAEHQQEGYVPMKDVANRQGLSLKYLEQILPALTKNNIVEGIQGKVEDIDWFVFPRSIQLVKF